MKPVPTVSDKKIPSAREKPRFALPVNLAHLLGLVPTSSLPTKKTANPHSFLSLLVNAQRLLLPLRKAITKSDESAKRKLKQIAHADAISNERTRCKTIIAHGIATNCVHQAASFAFDTDLSATHAVKVIDASLAEQPKRGSGLRERMASTNIPNVGADGGPSTPDPQDPSAKAAAIVQAGQRRRGEIK